MENNEQGALEEDRHNRIHELTAVMTAAVSAYNSWFELLFEDDDDELEEWPFLEPLEDEDDFESLFDNQGWARLQAHINMNTSSMLLVMNEVMPHNDEMLAAMEELSSIASSFGSPHIRPKKRKLCVDQVAVEKGEAVGENDPYGVMALALAREELDQQIQEAQEMRRKQRADFAAARQRMQQELSQAKQQVRAQHAENLRVMNGIIERFQDQA